MPNDIPDPAGASLTMPKLAPSAEALQQPLPPAPEEHHNFIGRAVKHIYSALNPPTTQYSVDPSGKMVGTEVPAQRKPGDLFRHMVAGALLGGVMSQQGEEGAARMKEQERQEEAAKRQQAAEEFSRQQDVKKQANADLLLKAQLAHINAQTANEIMASQDKDLEYHEKMAERGRDRLSAYEAMDMKPVYTNKSVGEMHQLFKDVPDAQHLHWEVTDTDLKLDAQGNPMWEPALTAYRPRPEDKIKITEGMHRHWKDAKMEARYGEAIYKRLPVGRELSVPEFYGILENSKRFAANERELEKAKLGERKTEAEIKELTARAIRDLAEARERKKAEKMTTQMAEAFDEWKKVGDIKKVGSANRLLIVESLTKTMQANRDTAKTILSDPLLSPKSEERKQAYDLIRQNNRYSKIAEEAFFPEGAEPFKVPTGARIATHPETGEKLYSTDPKNIPANEAAWFSAKDGSPASVSFPKKEGLFDKIKKGLVEGVTLPPS